MYIHNTAYEALHVAKKYKKIKIKRLAIKLQAAYTLLQVFKKHNFQFQVVVLGSSIQLEKCVLR